MTKKEREFVRYVKAECRKHGIRCVFRKVSYFRTTPGSCIGYFDDANKVLAVAMKRSDWIETLAHEFAHLTQWQDGIDLWHKSERSVPLMEKWLLGKPVRRIKRHLEICRDLELDNEKRTVKIIKKFKLNVDLDNYIRKANAYIHFYNHIYHTRKWNIGSENPRTDRRKLSVIPANFRMNYSKIPKKIQKIYFEQEV